MIVKLIPFQNRSTELLQQQYLHFDRCKIDTNSLSYLLSIPTLENVEFGYCSSDKGVDVTDINNISQLQFPQYHFTRLEWRDRSNYDVFEVLLANTHLQKNLQDLEFSYPTIESKDKFNGKLIQLLLRLKTIDIWYFECFGAEYCPFITSETHPLQPNLTTFKITYGKVCQHMVDYLRKITSLKEIYLYDTKYENDEVKRMLGRVN